MKILSNRIKFFTDLIFPISNNYTKRSHYDETETKSFKLNFINLASAEPEYVKKKEYTKINNIFLS